MPIRLSGPALTGAFLAAGLLAACDRSPQNADGTTEKGDLGTAASTIPQSGVVADTGHDNAASGTAGVGSAGEVGTPQSIGGATSPDGMTGQGGGTAPGAAGGGATTGQ